MADIASNSDTAVLYGNSDNCLRISDYFAKQHATRLGRDATSLKEVMI
jgi:hypothetical protein